MGYQAPADGAARVDQNDNNIQADQDDQAGMADVLQGMGAGIQAPQQVRDQVAQAATPLDAARALEAMFFGKVSDVEKL